jgi:hypothetical protein
MLIWFLVNDWDPNCLHYWGIVVYSVLVWLKIRLKWNFLTKLKHCIQQYPSNVNNWDPNRTPKPDKGLFLYRGIMMAPCS